MGLIPCSSCDRHVRADDKNCPFCDARLGGAGSGGLAAVAAAAALALAGCGSKAPAAAEPPGNDVGATEPDAGVDEAPPDDEPPDDYDRGGGVQPLYGVDSE